MRREWRRGIDELRSGAYWEAHESWEDIWKALPESPAREAMQALIQFAAACYKIDQARDGRSEEAMQRGMEQLVELARDHLDEADELEGPKVAWSTDQLRAAFGELEEALAIWRRGATIAAVASEVSTVAERLAADLDVCDDPIVRDPRR